MKSEKQASDRCSYLRDALEMFCGCTKWEFTKIEKDRIIKAGGDVKIRSRCFPTCFYHLYLGELRYVLICRLLFIKRDCRLNALFLQAMVFT